MAFTTPRDWTTGEFVTEAMMDTHVRDNFLAMDRHLIVRKTANQTVTSSAVLVNDATLVLPVAANDVWRFEFNVIYSAGTAADLKVGFTFPAAGEIVAYSAHGDSNATLTHSVFTGTTTPTATKHYFGNGVSEKIYLTIPGLFINAGTAGNLTMQWAQNASDAATTTVYANSTLWAVKLA
jgi:hypothetical protein